MQKITLNVQGMTCNGCVASVTKVLKPIDGVKNVNVTLQPGQATIEFDPTKAHVEQFRTAIEVAGYDVVD